MADEEHATHSQIVGLIKFAISDLSSQNGHHSFEDLCRNLARKTVASNILPATGPVSAGGDQGRDFETFRTFLATGFGEHGGFAGLASNEPIAFICTLQKDGLPTKIREDVTKVAQSGTPVDHVYVYLGSPLPVAKRHELQEEALEKHGIKLEILDSGAIAELLSARDLFWIAEQYLSIPSSLQPPDVSESEPLPDWYVDDRKRWKERGHVNPTLGEFSDVAHGLRHARRTIEARSDLAFWLDLVRPLAVEEGIHPEVRHRAQYEVAIAELRGNGSLRPADQIVRSFLEEALESEDPALLLDAGVVISYTGTAAALGLTDLSSKEIKEINGRFRTHISELVSVEDAPTRKARLLHALGFLGSVPDPEFLDQLEPREQAEGAERAYYSDYSELGIEAEVIAAMKFTAKEDTLAAWSELAGVLASTPLFPVDELAQKLDFLSPAFVDDPRWEGIQSAIDESLRRLHGDNAVAERERDRALARLRAGETRKALHHFHAAAQLWWNGDTLRGALLAMLGAADAYRELGLHQASKQYALAVAGAALADGREEVQDLIPHSVLVAAHADYMAGAWANAVQFIEAGFELQQIFIDEEVDVWIQRDDESSLLSLIWAFVAARSAGLAIADEIEDICERHGVLEMFEKLLTEVGDMSVEKLNELVDEQGAGRPFADLGATREIRFAALGTKWRITSENTYLAARAAERLAGAAQLLLVQVADDDLCLVPLDIEVHVETLDESETQYSIERDFSATSRKWVARVTPLDPGESMDAEALHFELLGLLATILADASALSQKDYFSALEGAFERGLGAQLVVGRPYDETAELVDEDKFSSVDRSVESPFKADAPEPVEDSELEWQDGPGPTYSDEVAKSSIELRYERIPRLIPHTLEAIGKSPAAIEVIAELRKKGWLDWQILTALANISINNRLEAKGLNVGGVINTPDGMRRAQAVIQEPEQSPAEAVDPTEISVESLDQARLFAVGSYLKVWDLEPRTGIVDNAAYDRLVSRRYRYWEDDVPHPDPFRKN